MASADTACEDVGDEAQPEQPLVAVKPRGRPSNWTKRFAIQQMKESREQTNKSAQKSGSPQETQIQPRKSPAPETATKRRGAETRARKPKGGIFLSDSEEAEPDIVVSKYFLTPNAPKSASPASHPTAKDDIDTLMTRDDDSSFEGETGSLFGKGNESENSIRGHFHEVDSLFVGDDEPEHPQTSPCSGPFARRGPVISEVIEPASLQQADIDSQLENCHAQFRETHEAAQVQSKHASPDTQDVNRGSVFGRNGEAAAYLLGLSAGQNFNHRLPFPESAEHAVSPPACSSGREDTRDTPLRITDVAAAPQSSPSSRSEHINISAKLHSVVDEVRRWEAVTQQVATATAEMADLVRDLAARSFAARPPSATVGGMLSAEDQARFRGQLLKATQLSLKADLIRTLEERDSEARQVQMYCVFMLAVAVVLAAFMVSPFAGRVLEWLDWALVGK